MQNKQGQISSVCNVCVVITYMGHIYVSLAACYRVEIPKTPKTEFLPLDDYRAIRVCNYVQPDDLEFLAYLQLLEYLDQEAIVAKVFICFILP